MTLGGARQYVLLRGPDREAPILVNVHGGPGMSERALYRHHNSVLEEHFIVAYWDQRGAGKSFDRRLNPASLTIAQMARDLTQLVDTLCDEFGRSRILLLAHSWGTVLALEHIAKRPETVAAYVGVGQVVNPLESEVEGYEWLLSEARKLGKSRSIRALERIGRPPWTARQFLTQRRHLYALNGFYRKPPSPPRFLREILASPETRLYDLVTMFRSMRWSIGHIWTEYMAYDAVSSHTRLEAPVYLMLGRHDHAVSPRLANEWLDGLKAPQKEVIWYENAGHMIPMECPAEFNRDVLRIGRDAGLLTL